MHGLTAILPGLLLLFYLRDQHPETLIEVLKYRSMYQNQSDFTADKQTTRGDPASPGSAVSFARPAWMNYRSCLTCSPTASQWSAQGTMPLPLPLKPLASCSRKPLKSTHRVTGLNPALPTGRKSTATEAKPIRWNRSKNVSSSTRSTSKTGRSGLTSTSCSAWFRR